MLAVDTNVIVRYLTNDHPQQSARARKLIEEREIWVSVAVVLETEWVLRSAYRHAPAQIAKALRQFAGLSRVSFENPGLVAQALDWSERGLDLADALHLGAADQCEAFLTFDRAFARAATRAGAHKVRRLE